MKTMLSLCDIANLVESGEKTMSLTTYDLLF